VSNLRRVGQPPATSTDAFGVPTAPAPNGGSGMRPDEELISYPANSREHRLWLQREREAATKPAVPQKSIHELAHEAHEQRKAEWAERERRDREAIVKANEDREAHNQKVIAERAAAAKAKNDAIIAEVARESMYSGWNVSDEERARIEKLVVRNHRGDKSVDLRERILLKMRNVG
jgi:hypothetical protein